MAATAIVCFGEVVWDMLPTGRQAGGAPLHVAVYLGQLGQSVQLITRIGDDELGTELLRAMTDRGISPDLVQRSATHLTGVVKTTRQPGQAATHKIPGPAAWDFIQHTEVLRGAVAGAQALVFGTLAARRATTRETLYRLLQVAPFRVLNFNLRAPHCTREVAKYLLRHADLVKLTQRELTTLAGWFGLPHAEELALPALAERFGLQAVCLTKDAAASLWTAGQFHASPAVPMAAPPQPGSSSAFTAALLAGWLSGQPPAACLRRACAAQMWMASRGIMETPAAASPQLTS